MLIVDDEPDDLQKLAQTLERAGGFETIAGEDYDDALEAFTRNRGEFDLAILDVALPGKSGVELAKELLARKANLRVLFVSGHVGAEVIRSYGMKANDDHFLRKPFDSAALLDRVNKALTWENPAIQWGAAG